MPVNCNHGDDTTMTDQTTTPQPPAQSAATAADIEHTGLTAGLRRLCEALSDLHAARLSAGDDVRGMVESCIDLATAARNRAGAALDRIAARWPQRATPARLPGRQAAAERGDCDRPDGAGAAVSYRPHGSRTRDEI